MVPLAPGRLSMTMFVFSRSPIFLRMGRATVSFMPPGGKGTITWIGLVGYFSCCCCGCCCCWDQASGVVAAMAMASVRVAVRRVGLLVVFLGGGMGIRLAPAALVCWALAAGCLWEQFSGQLYFGFSLWVNTGFIGALVSPLRSVFFFYYSVGVIALRGER